MEPAPILGAQSCVPCPTYPLQITHISLSCDREMRVFVEFTKTANNKRISGGFRNLERGVQSPACEVRPKIFGLPRPLPVTLEVQTEYLEATLGLAKHLEISKELIRECVTVPDCCCMPLLYNHLMNSCSYVRKYTLLAAKGGYLRTLNLPLSM